MSLPLIIDVTNPEQDGILSNFLSEGKGIEQDFVRGDRMLAFVHRPVVPSITRDIRPWDDDWLDTDTFQVAVGNKDTPPTSGTWPLGIRAGTIATSSIANPTVITTTGNHNLVTGDTVLIAEHAGSVPDINGTHVATVTGATTFTIPVNVTTDGTGGYVNDGEGMEALSYAILAASLTTTLSALSVKHGYPALTVVLLATGSYQVTWATAVAVPSLYSPLANNLVPDGSVTILVDEVGDSTTQALQIIILRQSPIAYAEPDTPLPDADIVATVTRAGDATHNKIYALTMTDGIYGGSFSVTVTATTGGAEGLGVVSGLISAQDFGNLLATQSIIASTDNVSVTRVGDVLNVEFIGAQGNSNVPVIAVSNIDLLAPKGVSGTIDFNTVSLYRAFLATTASELEYTFSIRRLRASGEEAEYFQHIVTLKRSLLDATTLVPVNVPGYYNTTQSDARYARLGANTDITSLQGTATNDNAAAGKIGEFTQSIIAAGAAAALTTGLVANVTSLSLTAGDWTLDANINYKATGATTTATAGGITTTSATIPNDGSEVHSGQQTITTTYKDSVTISGLRMSLAATTTVYLVANVTFSAGTVSVYGQMSARRMR